jgi:hypothetical protein
MSSLSWATRNFGSVSEIVVLVQRVCYWTQRWGKTLYKANRPRDVNLALRKSLPSDNPLVGWLLATGAPWYTSKGQIHKVLGVPFFPEHIKVVTKHFDLKVTRCVWNPLVRQCRYKGAPVKNILLRRKTLSQGYVQLRKYYLIWGCYSSIHSSKGLAIINQILTNLCYISYYWCTYMYLPTWVQQPSAQTGATLSGHPNPEPGHLSEHEFRLMRVFPGQRNPSVGTRG